MSGKGKRKRAELSLKQKLEIIAACEGFPKRSFAAVAKKFDVDRSTVSKIYKNKEVVVEVASSSNINRKRQRSSRAEDVDEALYRWFSGAVGRECPRTGEVLRKKAEKFAEELGVEGFLASNGWLDRWKKRYNIACRRTHGEEYERWVSGTLSKVLRRYKARDVYNAVETGLDWRALPKGWELVKEGEGGEGGCKVGKERITVVVCASMSGEKRPLVVIGKPKMSCCLSNVKSLPVECGQYWNARMSVRNFESWIRAWDKEVASEKRKIVVIMENCEVHGKVQFPHIELVLLPGNVSTFVQPCHQGIVRALKRHYRRLIVLRLLAVIESSDQDVTALQLIQSIDFFGSIRLLKESWDMVTSETVIDGFRKAKFCEDTMSIMAEESEKLPFIKEEIELETMVNVEESGEWIEAEGGECSGREGEKEESETEASGTVVTKGAALKALEVLQTFLSKGGIQDWRHFNHLEAQVQHLILHDTKRIPESALRKWIKTDK